MKKLLLLLALVAVLSTASAFTGMDHDDLNRKPQSSFDETENVNKEATDTPTVSVIAWFSKRDTMTYWVNESEWKVKDGDTVKTMSISMKVMLTVTDSTKNGYDMEYKFLEFAGDTLADSEIGRFQNRLVEKLGNKIIGTSIKFKTDELGQITEYKNLKGIKKQAKRLYKDACTELMEMPVIDSLKMIGIDFSSIAKNVNTDALVDGYTEELELMLMCHGNEYAVGESKTHKDATESEYASDTEKIIMLDKETGEYQISVNVDSHIPKKDLKNLVGQIVESIGDGKTTDSFNKEFDKQVTGDAVVNTYFSIKYFADGWPQEVVNQTNTTILGQGKLKQTYITWDYRSVGNTN